MACTLILALDLPDRDRALAFLDRLQLPDLWVKIGLQLFTRHGPELVETIAARGHPVFLDLKLHDIPNTVASAVGSLAHLPVSLLTLHASGGREMLAAAAAEAARHTDRPRLLGVTVLTSMDAAGLQETGCPHSPEDQVGRLAALALSAGLDGLVCSPLEAARLRQTLGPAPLLVTPGVRPLGADADEQRRVLGPAEAARAGASHIVVGRPILRAPDPAAAARAIRAELAAAATP
ncbi:MAG: orotidine-5'-phosphate decarboxylase [Puniceicoccaceae bacterium]|nr:MAG: orotidine-5'-phosphate decarboxylase [Puniceicoccaceae bacterium]